MCHMSCRDLETSVTEYFFHKKALEKLHCKVFVSKKKNCAWQSLPASPEPPPATPPAAAC